MVIWTKTWSSALSGTPWRYPEVVSRDYSRPHPYQYASIASHSLFVGMDEFKHGDHGLVLYGT